MTPSEIKDTGSLQSHLEFTTVRRATELIGSAELSRLCSILVDDLRAFQGCRIALTSQHAEHIMIGLAAGQTVGCDVLLHRTASIPDELLHGWGISAVIDSSLHVTRIEQRNIEASETRILIATSGTTGEPKLAEHSLDGLLGRVRQHPRAQNRSRWLLVYHPATFGGLQVLLTVLTTGAELVTVTPSTIPALSDAALAYQPTHVSATPTFWRSFLMFLGPRATDLHLKQITLGGEIADESILERLRATFKDARVSHIYASTEAGALFSVQDGHPGFPSAWLEAGIDDVALRVRDGVLQVRSPRAMKRYVNKDTEAVITSDGWLITGDMVEQVGDRVLFRGREDVMLNVGGAKVQPEEVEAQLLGLPEVVEASVYGVPNPLTGMVVGADIVLRADLMELDARRSILAQLRRKLESYKVPRVLHFVDTIEVSQAGKKERQL